MEIFLWTLLAFASGSLMFSYWIGLAVLRRDIRTVGDSNPGASNLVRAGGKGWGLVGLFLDYAKGIAPVLAARSVGGIEGAALMPVALAPVLGHAFSPWLRGRGGKAVAVTFGVWTGVSLWEGPVVLGALLSFWYALSARDGWTVFVSTLCFVVYLALREVEGWLGIGLGCWAVLAVKHYNELRQGWAWRPWVRSLYNSNR
ncbi:MAG: glycerol-3-phosphate acyltransferase [Candidatus Bipolaricaulota bacterium]|nr:glycerol-3-phosphate acyltransferase [Candidatus Bipolaricaulota bacterium]